MARHRGAVLVDTNVIIECWRVSAWRALTGGYQVETVQMCEIETQTGLQRRRREQQIDLAELRASLKAVHAVSDNERATALLRDEQFSFLEGSWSAQTGSLEHRRIRSSAATRISGMRSAISTRPP